MRENLPSREALQRAREQADSELSRLADVGELAGPLAHEFNNYLNCVLLQMAVLEAEGVAEENPQLGAIRELSLATAALVAQFQDYRRRDAPPAGESDLNATVLRVATALGKAPTAEPPGSPIRVATPSGDVTLTLRLGPEPLVVPVSNSDLERLVTFLVVNAVAAAGSAVGGVTVRTERADRQVRLSVEDNGPSVPPSALPRFFDLTTTPRPGTNILELAACKSIVNRTEGRVVAVNLSEGGLAIHASWERSA